MKQLFFFIASCVSLMVSAQTNTFNGAISNNWNVAANWTLNTVPTALHDVVIPTGKSVEIYNAATTKSLQLQGTATLFLSSNLSILQTSSIAANATFNWSGGVLSGGGTLNNLGALNFVPAGGKYLTEATIINNSGTMTFTTDWNLSINDGTVNNLSSGIMDFQSPLQIGYSGTGSHLLNNQGLIKKTGVSSVSSINTDFNNTGTLSVESGYLDLNGGTINLNGGIYNASAGAQLRWYNSVNCSGTLTGNLVGDLVWAGDVKVSGSAAFNFANHFYWSSGTLSGGGSLTNLGLLTIAPASGKSIIEQTTLNNPGLININTDWNMKIVDGTLNNTASGIIDFQATGSNIESGSVGNLHAFNNAGLIKKTGPGSSRISADLLNTGTISVENGTLELNDDNIILNNGIYNVMSGTDFRFLQTVTLSGTLTGNLDGALLWFETVNVPTLAVLQFLPNSNFNWVSGTLTGGGTLRNDSTFYYSSVGTKYLDGAATLTNASRMNFTTDWPLQVMNGTINNLAAGIIDLQVAANINRNGSGLHAFNNIGLIKKTGSTGAALLYLDLVNIGTIESSIGTIAFDNLLNTPTGIVSGIGNIQLAAASGSMTNNGIFSPGGSPGVMGFYGNYTSTASTRFAVELNGLTQGTQHDYMFIVGDAVMNGSVVVTLGFDPAINDEFIIATTSGLITFGMTTTTVVNFGGMTYTFDVFTSDDNKLKLKLTNKVLGTETMTEIDRKIILAPNPAKNFTMLINQSGQQLDNVAIFDSSGRKIKTIPLTGTIDHNEIRLDGLASGQYFLKIDAGKSNIIKRFIVE
ncbi:T9SS type A sorting domain-containing protein [Flavobacterium sp.]|uniref:T9SS type A sorting domain-containing protein n=1 Tax=Flavobacterium sp. TaxID=239 RepID=UPI00286A74AF|nr:T9SS type A sorting domain-containing protein [Flavobacterium sp.]